MNKVKKVILSSILMLSIFSNSTIITHADINTAAQKLYELGLLSNISNIELNTTLDRIVGLTMILKTLGYTDEDAGRASKDHQFTDFKGKAAWGEGWANIGVATGVTIGTSVTNFSPLLPLTKREFLTYQLRVLGYGAKESWDNCEQLAIEAGLITSEFDVYEFERFTKTDAANIIYTALNCKLKGHQDIFLIDQLIADGMVSYDVAITQNFPSLTDLKMSAVQPLGNNKVEVSLTEAVKYVASSEFTLSDSQGVKVTILSATLSSDGKTVVLLTGAQRIGYIHTITCESVALTYNPLSVDTVKPRITSSYAVTGKKVKLTFSENVDLSALNINNYKINDLSVTAIEYELDSLSKPIKTNILLTTTTQTVNLYYKVIVTNVKDPSDNIIDANYDEAVFIGRPSDTVKPRVIYAYPLTNTLLRVTFSEDVEKVQAENIANYRISGLTVVTAVRQSSPSVVYLTTTPQTVGYLYSLYVYQITDIENNTIDLVYNSYAFYGMAMDLVKPTLISAVSLSNTTIKVTFSEPITNETGSAQYAYDLGTELIYPSKVAKDTTVTDGSVWILTTEPQLAKQYTLDITGVQDMSGNVLDELVDSVSFMGQI